MQKRLLVIFICAAVLLSACSPRLVGEAKAKEAGLAMINQAYGVDLTDAVVAAEYHQGGGVTYEDGVAIHYGTEEPMRFYEIRVNPGEGGNADYYAVVNAVTGVAYRADKDESLLSLTQEQHAQAEAIGKREDLPIEDFEDDEANALQTGEDWVRAHFEPDIPVLRTVPNSTMTDGVEFPLFFVDGSVIFIDGTIYNVEVCWPAMEVTSVYLCNQEY
jgi:hypothetical protein